MAQSNLIGKFVVRPAQALDVDRIIAINTIAFDGGAGGVIPITREQVVSWMETFPDGLQVAERNGELVAVGMAMIKHSDSVHDVWYTDTDNGMITSHDPSGDVLYGVSLTSLAPGAGQAIIIAARRNLAAHHPNVKEFVLHSRVPGMRDWVAAGNHPESYPLYSDRTVQFYEAAGFTPQHLSENFFKEDEQSMGYAAHCVLRLP